MLNNLDHREHFLSDPLLGKLRKLGYTVQQLKAEVDHCGTESCKRNITEDSKHDILAMALNTLEYIKKVYPEASKLKLPTNWSSY